MGNAKTDKDFIAEIDGKLTFGGFMIQYYDELCSKNFWRAESTRRNYKLDYTNRIIPNLLDHDNKTIDNYTKADYEEAVNRILAEKTISSTRAMHFRLLIYVVVELAAEKGLCENILWGTCFELPENIDKEERITELVRLKKSLTPEQEIRSYEFLTRDISMNGEFYGVYLMLTCGLRDAEACAVNFGDIITPYDETDMHLLMIYKTIESKEHKVISSGKTKNADRLIPIPKPVYHHLMKRKEYIMHENGLDPKTIMDYPIACRPNDSKSRCLPSDMSNAARVLFMNIGLQGKVLAYLEYELEYEKNPVIAKEKDPTAYLFRRNFATQLTILGFEEPEIQYLIGHDIASIYETRNEFMDSSKLRNMYKKMNQRAVFAECNRDSIVLELHSDQEYTIESAKTSNLQFKVEKGDITEVIVKNCETDSNLQISVRSKIKDSVTVSDTDFKYDPSWSDKRTINIIDKYQRVYDSKKHEIKNSRHS